MMKLWSHAVVIDTGLSIDTADDYIEASTELDTAMLAWANSAPISVYFKNVSEETVDLQLHEITWSIEAAHMEDGESLPVILCKMVIDVQSSSKPDIMKPNLRMSLLDKLAAVCPALKTSTDCLMRLTWPPFLACPLQRSNSSSKTASHCGVSCGHGRLARRLVLDFFHPK